MQQLSLNQSKARTVSYQILLIALIVFSGVFQSGRLSARTPVISYAGCNVANTATPSITSFNSTIGPVGTLVTITGSNLSSPTAFTIGGATAIVVSNDGSTLVGMVMPGAVTGAIVITTADGTTTSSSNFTVTGTPSPSIQQGAKLLANDNNGSANQGMSVAISADGNTAVVGGTNDNGGQGAAWIYTCSGGVWTQQGAKLVGTGNIGAASQGTSVAISADGNSVIIGGTEDNNEQGAAWIFTRSGGIWTQQGAKLVGTDNIGAALQGYSVAISADGNTAVVGGEYDDSRQGAVWIFTRNGGVWTQQGTKLVGTDVLYFANQGYSVAISADGNTVISGGQADNAGAGAVWVFTRSGNTWSQQGAKLMATDNSGVALQGTSVAISADGNTAIVGGTADNNYQGAAWIYTRSGGAWTQQGTKLVGTGASGAAWQGKSVALSADGNTAMVGGYQDNNRQGAAWVYTRIGGAWIQQGTKLVGNDASGAAWQGASVALSADGSAAMVGGGFDNTSIGAAWVFTVAPPSITSFNTASGPAGTLVTITGSGLGAPTAFTIGGATAIVVSNDGSTLIGMVMPGAVTGAISITTLAGTATSSSNFTVTNTPYPSVQQGGKLLGTGNVGAAGQGASVAVSADGNTAVVGGGGDNSYAGAAWIYTRSAGVWVQQGAKLVGTGANGVAAQGSSAAISADGNTVIIGGYEDNSNQGAAWVFTRNSGIWTQQGAKLVGTGNIGAAEQGISVAISADGNTAMVGGLNDNSQQGAAWVFTRNGGVWTQQGAKLVGTGAGGAAQQGKAVAISADGNTAMIGGYGDNSSQGAVWVFTRNGSAGVWVQQGAKLVGTGSTGSAEQGYSVALSADGNTAITGGVNDNSSQGAAWIFTRSGGIWAQQGTQLVGTGGIGIALQGVSVAISADGNTASVGGPLDNSSQGAAWVYNRSGGAWTQQGTKLLGTGSIGGANQGNSVALSADGSTVLIGGPGDNSQQGAAWAFTVGPPTTQATYVTFTNTTKTTTTANWTNGNGTSRAVFVAAATSGSPAPVDFTNYNANAAFGSGDQIGSTGWYCVYNGVASSVNVTGLTAGTTYQVMVVEYNGSSSNAAYLTSAGTGNPAALTTLSSPPVISSFSSTTGPVGTLVTITGSRLSSPTAFTIGGATAIVVSNDGNTLVGMVMPGAVTGAIAITTADGTTTSSSNFTVTSTPFPSVQQGAKLLANDNAGSAQQGYSVAVSADGNTAIVGGTADNGNAGAAWVYTRSAGVWTQQGSKLAGTGRIGNAGQEWSVAISADGNTAVVGGYADNSGQGAAWIFTRSAGIWTQQGAKLVGTGNIGTAYQGYSVAISADGNTAVVGGIGDNTFQGAVWVFTRNGSVWTQQGAKLVGTGSSGAALQGYSVALSADGNTAMIGGNGDNGNQGAAWIYIRSGSVWTQQGAKLVGTGSSGAALQGYSVALSADGNTAMIGGNGDNGNQGAAWIYIRSGGAWTQQGAKLVGTGSTGAAGQGSSVALSADGNTAMVSGAYDNSQQGAAWVYTRSGGAWTQQGTKLVGTGGIGNSNEGNFVALSADGGTAIAGGPYDNSTQGAAWVFVPSVTAPTTQATNVTFTTTTATTTTASWTTGNGIARAVFMAAASSGSPAPVDLTTYNANATFGSGDQIGATGWYCVYNGVGSLINITGLTAGTAYQLMVVEYTGSGSNVAYLTTAGTGNPAAVTTHSTDAVLANLTISNGALSPAFSPATIIYTDAIANFTSGITVVPTTDDPNATVTINGIPATSGVRTASIPMSVGANTLTIVVTASDGVTTKTYTVNISRGVPTNALLSGLQLTPTSNLLAATGTGNYNYTATVPNSEGTVQVTATAQDAAAAITVNGVPVTSGSASLPINLNVGTNTITTQVTAEDGTTIKTYTVTLTRAAGPPSHNALLTSIKLSPVVNLLGGSGPGYVNLTATVPTTESTVQVVPTVQDANATVTVNGTAVTSGATSSPVTLNVGANTITTQVTAQDGTTIKNYIITVTRLAPPISHNATLAFIKLSPNANLLVGTGPGYLNLTATVPNSESTVQVIPTVQDATATVTVNGTAVTSGATSNPITLSVGTNTITAEVTAQDGTTIRDYIVTLTRLAPPPSTNAQIATIAMSPTVSLIGTTGSGYLNFTSNVPNSFGSIQQTVTLKDANATMTVNGTPVNSGAASGPITLSVGANTITTVVTAQDGVTTKTVIVTINRAAPPSANAVYQGGLSINKPSNNVTVNDDGIAVHAAVSPNGDGVNDALVIDNIWNYPDNHLTIVDRNGMVVYEAKGYDNITKPFDGHSTVNGKLQQSGTYFYSLDYIVKGEDHHTTGFIILKY